MTCHIFVFGTLKQGFPNHEHNSGRKMDGDFVTVYKYPLFLVGERHSPWMINDPGQGLNVQGELYEMDYTGLELMDRLERIHSSDGYRRQAIEVRNLIDDSTVQVFAYFKSPSQLEIEYQQNQVKSGPFSSYTSEHAAQYRSRSA